MTERSAAGWNRLAVWLRIALFSLPLVGSGLVGGCALTGGASVADGRLDTFNCARAAQARLTLGEAYLEQGNLTLAYRNLRRAAEYDPANHRVHLALALYEQRLGEHDKARRYYVSALALAPGDGAVLSRYGDFLCRLGQYNEANAQFELALNHISYDTIAESLESAGYCRLEQRQYQRAQEFLSRALNYEPAKSLNLLVATEHYLTARRYDHVAVLLDIYQQNSPITAESLWLQIRFAALTNRLGDVQRYGQRLAKNFSQSEQYKKFLAHEY